MVNAKRALLMVAVVMFAGLIAGCASSEVETKDPGVMLGLDTFGWLPYGQQFRNAYLEAPHQAIAIRLAVDAELKARNYRLMPFGKPSFWVTYYAVMAEDITDETLNNRYVRVRGYRADAGTTIYEKGTLVVDIIPLKDQAVVWRGSTPAGLDEDMIEADRQHRIREAAAMILSGIPAIAMP